MATRVLIVDDDDDGREAMRLLLTLWGYEADTAATGEDALDVAASRRPEIVILDLGLPGMMGEAVCAAIKAGPSAPFVVVYTGYERLETQARMAGCDAFILKPEIDGLRTALTGVLTKKASGA